MSGEVQITYTEEHQSGFHETKAELIKARNELEAYREAFDEGTKKQLLHDLSEKNAQDSAELESN